MIRAFVNRVFSFYYRGRMRHIQRYMDRPDETQQSLLQQFVREASSTVWGREHGYSRIRTYDDFRGSVTVQDYDMAKPYIQRMMHGERDILWPGRVKWYSKSSGTTSDKSKYIPVTYKNLYGCHIRGGWDSMTMLYTQYPSLEIFQNKNLVMGGSIAPFPPYPKTLVGDVSAIMLHHLPAVGRPFYALDMETALNPDVDEKIDNMVKILSHQNLSMIGGVPTWMVVLFRRILEYTGKSHMLEVWPGLKVYMHGGVSFKPYKEQFREFIPSDDFIYQEIYNASEGFFAAQDLPSMDDGMLLLLNNGIFFEFIPSSEWHKKVPEAIPLREVELGKNYAVVITTNSGLWRYAPGDTVMFTSVKPYRIKVTGRTKQYVNVFGEEVMVENTDVALNETCRQTGAIANEYTVAPIYFNGNGKGGHEWLIEFEREPDNVEDFNRLLDINLQKVNSDYEAKRHKNVALERLKLKVLPRGTFLGWMKSRGKFGGQNKIPRLANHRQYIEEIIRYTEKS